jgi:hypothetical protein
VAQQISNTDIFNQCINWTVEHFWDEVAAVSAAPVFFSASVIVAAVILYCVFHWRYSDRLEARNETIRFVTASRDTLKLRLELAEADLKKVQPRARQRDPVPIGQIAELPDPTALAAPANHPAPNIVYARQEIGEISDPLNSDTHFYEPVDALLLSFRNAPTPDHAIAAARTVSASITYVKLADRAMLEVQRAAYMAQLRDDSQPDGEETRPEVDDAPQGFLAHEEILIASWRTNVRVNEVSFERNSIRDLIIMFKRDGKFYALEDLKIDRPYSRNRTPELTEGKWKFRVRFAIDGKLDGQSHYFTFFSFPDDPGSDLHVMQSFNNEDDWPFFLYRRPEWLSSPWCKWSPLRSCQWW